eukprot:365057-Chlamydomonas_euryale.AAC.22
MRLDILLGALEHSRCGSWASVPRRTGSASAQAQGRRRAGTGAGRRRSAVVTALHAANEAGAGACRAAFGEEPCCWKGPGAEGSARFKAMPPRPTLSKGPPWG